MPCHMYGFEMVDCVIVSHNLETSVFALSKSCKYSSLIGQLLPVASLSEHDVVVHFLSNYFQRFVFFFKSW